MSKQQIPEYNVWRTMKARCNNPNNRKYHRYGGRGIKVCSRWEESFENFISDMGERPSPKHSIDRKDNDKGYNPENCEWAVNKIQARNKGMSSCNTTGVTGVTLERSNKGKTLSYRACWLNLQGIKKSKAFSINKYGEELAFFAACECREQMIELLNKHGAKYAPKHGKENKHD